MTNHSDIKIRLDFRSRQPIYQQIVAQIRQIIASGELAPGARLPTVRQLAAELGVNFNTVARAYRLLDQAGLISTRPGRGTFVWDTPAKDDLRQESLDELTRRYVAQAARLAHSPDEVAKVLVRYLQEWKEGGDPPENVSRETI
jgi:GntR family transcriptional regulator